jgi:ketosteroid isomerase-like protein
MHKSLVLFIAISFYLAAAASAQKRPEQPGLKEMVEAERAFARTSVESNTRVAFIAFIADDGVLFRPHAVQAKKILLEDPPSKSFLTWEPVSFDIAASGDLGYTTGPWSLKRDRSSEKFDAHGQFFTVWKRQPDGSWKFAVDIGISHPQHLDKSTWVEVDGPEPGWKDGKADPQRERAALIDLDRNYCVSSIRKGLGESFMEYSSDRVRVLREGSFPALGKLAARKLIEQNKGQYSWTPAASDVSLAADLGYTYGLGQVKKGEGKTDYFNYLRVWKRRPGGEWKVVADVASPAPAPGN